MFTASRKITRKRQAVEPPQNYRLAASNNSFSPYSFSQHQICLCWFAITNVLVRFNQQCRELHFHSFPLREMINAFCHTFSRKFRKMQIFSRTSTFLVFWGCPQHLDAVVPATPNPGSRTRPQPAIDHYDAVSTFHDDNICETRFSMLCTSCLELTTKNCSQ